MKNVDPNDYSDNHHLRLFIASQATEWGKNVRTDGIDLQRLAYFIGPRIYLQGAYLAGANLLGAKLQEAYLQGANLQRANLQRANLQEANLLGAKLQRAYLQEAYLQEANLQRAYLQEANLQGADLQGANLQEAKLQGAYLAGADLQGADLRWAYLAGAHLPIESFFKANNWEQAQNIGKAHFYHGDKEIQGFSVDESGKVIIEPKGQCLTDEFNQDKKIHITDIHADYLAEFNLPRGALAAIAEKKEPKTPVTGGADNKPSNSEPS